MLPYCLIIVCAHSGLPPLSCYFNCRLLRLVVRLRVVPNSVVWGKSCLIDFFVCERERRGNAFIFVHHGTSSPSSVFKLWTFALAARCTQQTFLLFCYDTQKEIFNSAWLLNITLHANSYSLCIGRVLSRQVPSTLMKTE